MKQFFLFLLLVISSNGIAQKSYYFSAPLYAHNKIETVDARYFGVYIDEQGRKYNFNEEGVQITSTVISSISKDLVRESSKYSVNDGWLHGVVENDSIPCVLEGESYFFGVRNTNIIIGAGSQSILTKSDNGSFYYINTYDNGVYMPMKLIFSGKRLQIVSIDYEIDQDEFTGIENRKEINENNQTLVILSPTKSELQSVDFYFVLPKKLKLDN